MLAAVVAFACIRQSALADERLDRSASSGVAKTDVARPAPVASTAKSTKERIQQLIGDLGSPHYTTRRAAANELRQIGADAFDLLDVATNSADPEVASSANYLLRQVPIRWVQPDDHPLVRSAMRNFNQQADARRLLRVESLDQLSGGKGLAALCRIVRYDRSPLVSRLAAVAIIRPSERSKGQQRVDTAIIERELGASTRMPAQWLRQLVIQQRDPASSVAGWRQFIDQESAQLGKNLGDTSSDVLLGLNWNMADVYRQIGDQQALGNARDQMITYAAEASDKTLVSLLAWMTEHKSWDMLDAFIAKHQSRLEQSKSPLYYAALARAAEGKKDQAEELAAKAALFPSQEGTLEGLSIARDLEERSQFEWAVREYRQAIEKQSPDSIDSFLGRIWLANLLHDYEHEKEAAEALEPLAKAVRSEGRLAQEYRRLARIYHDQIDFPTPSEVVSRYRFYLASQYQDEKDWQRARGELELAIEADPMNADVLIDMYRLPETDAQWRKNVLARIHDLCQTFEKDIEKNSSDATAYNQWAWLVSNTEGDYQQAVRYSHRSLELNKRGESGAASFLDTLGRCYYAVGDYENAVKYEREAVAKVGYLKVMQRQLAEFEKALADKKANNPANNPANKPK